MPRGRRLALPMSFSTSAFGNPEPQAAKTSAACFEPLGFVVFGRRELRPAEPTQRRGYHPDVMTDRAQPRFRFWAHRQLLRERAPSRVKMTHGIGVGPLWPRPSSPALSNREEGFVQGRSIRRLRTAVPLAVLWSHVAPKCRAPLDSASRATDGPTIAYSCEARDSARTHTLRRLI